MKETSCPIIVTEEHFRIERGQEMENHNWELLKAIESPMMEQYVSFKEQYPEYITFFQVGDFYELYSQDAEMVSRDLSMKLTSREIAKMNIPMCGFPAKSCYEQAAQLATMGYKIVIVSQEKDEEGNVNRFIQEIITPATLSSEEHLSNDEHQNIMTVYSIKDELGVVLLDTLSGEISSQVVRRYSLLDLITRYQPKEILVYLSKKWEAEFMNRLTNAGNVEFFEVPFYTEEFKTRIQEYKEEYFSNTYAPYPVIVAHSFLTEYLKSLKSNFVSLKPIQYIEDRNYMYLSKTAVKNLELFENTNGKKDKTLFHLLNRTVTPKGSRKLKKWIQEPLLEPKEIAKRYQIVETFMKEKELRDKIRGVLKNSADVERIVARLETLKFKEYELSLLLDNMKRYEKAFTILSEEAPFPSLKEIADKFGSKLEKIISKMSTMIDEEEIIAKGYDSHFDSVRHRKENGLQELKDYAQGEIEQSGIKSMKLDENKVLGFFFEITQSHFDKTPEHFIERAKLSNKKRFVTEELKTLEDGYLAAIEEYDFLYRKVLKTLVTELSDSFDFIRKTLEFVSYLDVLMSFSELSEEKGYAKPAFSEAKDIVLKNGKHPLLEHFHYKQVVANSIDLQNEDIHILTGPNMGGKSTYLKTIALSLVMAQIGCFTSGKLMYSPVDRILLRMGAHDSILDNQSTFMVEMEEVAYILYHSTENSLILMDELGRGTSTSDGISIAHSVIRHIHEKIKAKTICSTHYHELVELESEFARVKNFHTEAKEVDGEVKLTFKIREGGSSRSFGIEVAKRVGLPSDIIENATDLLTNRYNKKTAG